MGKTVQTWIVSAEQGTVRDDYEATGPREAATVALSDMLRYAQPGDRVEICVWQEGDETVEVFYVTAPAGGEDAVLLGAQDEGYEEARAAVEADIARRPD